jgi:hypothetical protein
MSYPPKLMAKIEKLAALARCPAATSGEVSNATAMLAKIARKNQINPAGYEDLLAKVDITDSTPLRSKPQNAAAAFARQWTTPPVERPSSRPAYSRPPDPDPPRPKPADTNTPGSKPSESKSPWTKRPRSRQKRFKPDQLLSAMPSGRYRGRSFEEIRQSDPDFFAWVLRDPNAREIIKASIMAFINAKQPSSDIR